MTQLPQISSEEIAQLRDRVSQCMGAHRYVFTRRISQLSKMGPDKQQHAFLTIEQEMEDSIALRTQRQAQKPGIEYPDLPVSEHRADIADAIANHQVVIIAGETGSGKTTQIPKICLELGRGVDGLIGHTQPRRLAARSVSNRIAEELNSPIGQHVGFKIRFSDKVSDNTYIKLMTDGILLAEMQQDRFLNQYDTFIIDEAHERSLNIDFILGYLKQLLPKRPDLKLIITSATIDPERFSKHFDNAPIISVSGRTYPVEVRYRPFDESSSSGESDQTSAIVDAVHELTGEGKGDILVFLSGEREIRDTADALNKARFPHTEVLPLYARLSAAEQNKIFAPHGGRRIVLATNVAETSLTVPGIKYVIDPGFARISRYSARSKVQRLPIEAISQASANQRAGRCGRVSEGICIRLYSEDDYVSRPEFTDPEILRTNLASVILQMLSLKLGSISDFPFVQAPEERNINDGFRLLEELGAIHKQRGQFTLSKSGRSIAKLPVDPRYARMVVQAAEEDCLSEIIIIAAGLSIQDPRERPQEKRQAADEKHREYADEQSDFLSFLKLWNLFRTQQQALTNNQLRKWCKQHFLNFLRMREWQDIVSQLKKSIADIGFRLNSHEAQDDAVHRAIASGLLSHLGFKDKEREYLGARGSRFLIFPGSPLSKKGPKWVMVAELVETSRLFGRIAAKIDPAWIEPLAKHLVKYQYSEPHWSKKSGQVQAYESVMLYGQTLVAKRRVGYGTIDPVVSHELFIREALVNGETRLDYAFLRHNQRVVEDIQTLEDKSRRRDILVDEDTLVEFYRDRVPQHISSEAAFKKWWRKTLDATPDCLDFDPQALLKQDTAHVGELDYPDHWVQNNLRLGLGYEFEPNHPDDGVSLMIPLPVLNQVQDIGFDWLVPGFRHELTVYLIKSLPKRLRRNFVPAPDFATACLQDLPTHNKQGHWNTFTDALSTKLFKMTGVKVEQEDWQTDNLPSHLKFHFKVLDGKEKVIAQGDELFGIQQALQGRVKQTLQKAATPELEQKGITSWSFASLAREFVDKRGGFEVKAYPALNPEANSVEIKLFEQPHLAADAHALGLRKLVRINIPSPVKYLQEKLPNKAKLGLYFNPFGKIQALIDDCIDAGIDALIQGHAGDADAIRDENAFSELVDIVRQDINEQVLDIATKVEKGLTTAHGIQKKMKGSVPLTMINAHGDIKQHLSTLVFTGFVSALGAAKLDDWNRYIQGIARRLEKLPIDPNKDRLHQINVEKVQQKFDSALAKCPPGTRIPDELKEVRWMIEELRISFFAQQLGTAYPISAKRIENHLQSF